MLLRYNKNPPRKLFLFNDHSRLYQVQIGTVLFLPLLCLCDAGHMPVQI